MRCGGSIGGVTGPPVASVEAAAELPGDAGHHPYADQRTGLLQCSVTRKHRPIRAQTHSATVFATRVPPRGSQRARRTRHSAPAPNEAAPKGATRSTSSSHAGKCHRNDSIVPPGHLNHKIDPSQRPRTRKYKAFGINKLQPEYKPCGLQGRHYLHRSDSRAMPDSVKANQIEVQRE